MTEQGCLERLASVLLNIETKNTVLVEVTAALAVMADNGKRMAPLYLQIYNENLVMWSVSQTGGFPQGTLVPPTQRSQQAPLPSA